MSTLKTHNLQSPDAGSVNIAMAPNAGMVVAGLSTYSNQINVGNNIKLGNAGVITATSFVGSGANLTGLPAATTINNNADNRVITGTGSANTLNAESNVHVDGSGRLLIGTSTNNAHSNADNAVISGTGNIGLSIMSTDSGRSSIYFGDSSSSPGSYAGFIDFVHSDNSFNIGRGNDNSLKIDGSGRLLIGTTTEGFATYGDKFTIADSGHCGMTIRSGTSHYGTIYFSDGDDGSTDEVRGFIDYNHSNNQLQLGTNAATRLRIKSDGRLGINADPSVNHEYLHIKPVGNNVLDLRYELNSDTDIRHKFYDNAGVWRGGFNYTTYANSSAYPNFHDSFYFLTDPGSNGTLATALRITNTGQFIKPLTYQFFLESSGTSVSGGWTKLTGMSLDSTHCTGVSNGTYWSNSNQRFTAPVTGTYQFFIGGFSPTAEGGGTNHRYMYLFRINGGNYKYGMGGNYSDNNTPMEGGTLNYKLTVNDYVEVWYYSAISATWGNSSHRFFWGGILLG